MHVWASTAEDVDPGEPRGTTATTAVAETDGAP